LDDLNKNSRAQSAKVILQRPGSASDISIKSPDRLDPSKTSLTHPTKIRLVQMIDLGRTTSVASTYPGNTESHFRVWNHRIWADADDRMLLWESV